jgi:hypothetical protein
MQAACLVTAIEASPCSTSNQTCICTNSGITTSVELCLAETCTVKETLGKCGEFITVTLLTLRGIVATNYTQTACGAPIRSKTEQYRVISNVLGCISAAAVALRMFSVYTTHGKFGLDDYAIAITLVSGIPSTILTIHGLTSNGLGRDIWTVTPTQITNFIRVFYGMEILYFAQLALLKLSLLFFYLRIFPGKGFRKLVWGSITFDVTYGLLFVFIGLFQCKPISYYWKSWDGEHQGKCLNVNSLGWANAGISIILDGWMLALPMSQIIHLKMHWKKKVGVAMMFIVGTLYDKLICRNYVSGLTCTQCYNHEHIKTPGACAIRKL